MSTLARHVDLAFVHQAPTAAPCNTIAKFIEPSLRQRRRDHVGRVDDAPAGIVEQRLRPAGEEHQLRHA
ncbi:MAG: hypothetical protein ABJB02_07195 [Dokdonella sp.]